MNLHPIFVHFPITLLTIYCLFELVRWRKITNKHYWFYLKATLVILGAFSNFFALATGSMISNQFRGKLLDAHSTMAVATTIFFSVLAFLYLILWLEKDFSATKKYLPRALIRLGQIFFRTNWIAIILAIIGIFLITVTGTLGGALTYGPDIDPFARFFYNIVIH